MYWYYHGNLQAYFINLFVQNESIHSYNTRSATKIHMGRSPKKLIRACWISRLMRYIHLIDQARGPYWENIGPRSWQYGPSAARSVQKRPRADILPERSRASLVNKRFITRLKKQRRKCGIIRDNCPVRYLENIGPAIEHFDWLILVIGPLTAWVV